MSEKVAPAPPRVIENIQKQRVEELRKESKEIRNKIARGEFEHLLYNPGRTLQEVWQKQREQFAQSKSKVEG